MLENFKKQRLFYQIKYSCLQEKYEKRIQIINQNNSGQEELYKTIKDLQEQNEEMRWELL
jgi:hypothetical protein